jgi:hypothetical protein
MTLIPVDLEDDDVVFVGKKNRNFIVRKLFNHMPAGSFKIVCDGWKGEIIITLEHSIQYLEIGTSWKQIKRMLGREGLDPKTWECSICCEKPENRVTSTCDECLNTMCMKCFILHFEKNWGTIQCPWCRHITCQDEFTDEELAHACFSLREEHGIKHPDY